mgnify:CR=1 FL=1
MATSRKRPASASWQGKAVSNLWMVVPGAPTLDETMRRAGAIEMRYQQMGWSDAHESEALAQEAGWRSRDELTARGYLP